MTDTYAEKYSEADLKQIDASAIESVDECLWLMERLDHVIANIDEQLDHAKADKEEGLAVDAGWRISAKRALKGAKAKRMIVQERRGVLSRREKMQRQTSEERAFIDAAKDILPEDTFRQIWEAALND